MASAAYAYQKQTCSSEAQFKRSHFKLIEGGRPNMPAPKDNPEPIQTFVAPYVPEHDDEALGNTLPSHSGAVTFLVAVVIALAICVVSVICSNMISNKISDALATVPNTEYTVHAGDSVWSIAESHPIEGYSASDVVTWIMERNNLNNGLIIPGQSLLVPSQML